MNTHEIAAELLTLDRVTDWTTSPDGVESLHLPNDHRIALGDDDDGITWTLWDGDEPVTTDGWESEGAVDGLAYLRRFIGDLKMGNP